MANPTSIRLSQEAETALAWLRKRTGGFYLNQAVSQIVVAEAVKRGFDERKM